MNFIPVFHSHHVSLKHKVSLQLLLQLKDEGTPRNKTIPETQMEGSSIVILLVGLSA